MEDRTLVLSEPGWSYLLVAVLVVLAVIAFGFTIAWFIQIVSPSRHHLAKRKMFTLALMTGWLMPVGILLLWSAWVIGYSWFYSLRVLPDKQIVLHYLQPKGRVIVNAEGIQSIEIVRSGGSRDADWIISISMTDGKEYSSCALGDLEKTLAEEMKISIGAEPPASRSGLDVQGNGSGREQ